MSERVHGIEYCHLRYMTIGRLKEIPGRHRMEATDLIGSRQLHSDPCRSICVPIRQPDSLRVVLLLLVLFLFLAVAVHKSAGTGISIRCAAKSLNLSLYSSCKQHPFRLMLAYSLSVVPNSTLIQRLH